MKGTLFSADLVEDASGSMKLLEVNTDTAFASTSSLDYTDLKNIITNNSIATIEIIYKDFQSNFVNHFSTSMDAWSGFTGSFKKHRETNDTIYPAAVTDADTKFIIRLAYDENALFDSTYAKHKLNMHKLMLDYEDGDMVPGVFHSSSAFGLINTISDTGLDGFTLNHNDDRIPDFVYKMAEDTVNNTAWSKSRFFSVGETGSDDINVGSSARLLSENVDIDSGFLEVFHSISGSANDYAESYRSYQILYSSGSSLHNCYLGDYKCRALFEWPTLEEARAFQTTHVSHSVYGDCYWDEYPKQHFYQLSTNHPSSFKKAKGGVIQGTEIRLQDDSYAAVETLTTGSWIDSYFVSGSTIDGEGDINWRSSGRTFPSGSYITSSLIESIDVNQAPTQTAFQIVTSEGDEIICAEKSILVYDTGSNEMYYQLIDIVDPDIHWIPKTDGSLIDITENNIVIFEDLPSDSSQTFYRLYDVDVEEVDNFIISGSGQDLNTVSLVTHNPRFWFAYGGTCFAAGTEISLSNGDVKSIEDIVEGDEVLGWDGDSIQSSIVTAIDHRHTVNSHADACKSLGDEPSLYTINDTKIEFTPEHPFLTKGGWKSLVPDPTQKPYDSEQEPKVLGIGDEINKDGEWITIEDIRIVRSDKDEPVYNITVEGLHSYIANGIIVHNK
jgi:hypothetical protein|tara:strand:+ start:9539 stop:11542 length:2004 start_codon:yes stop_codon:yes gene_type:complete